MDCTLQDTLKIQNYIYIYKENHENDTRQLHIRNDDEDGSTIETGQGTTEPNRETTTIFSKDGRQGE